MMSLWLTLEISSTPLRTFAFSDGPPWISIAVRHPGARTSLLGLGARDGKTWRSTALLVIFLVSRTPALLCSVTVAEATSL